MKTKRIKTTVCGIHQDTQNDASNNKHGPCCSVQSVHLETIRCSRTLAEYFTLKSHKIVRSTRVDEFIEILMLNGLDKKGAMFESSVRRRSRVADVRRAFIQITDAFVQARLKRETNLRVPLRTGCRHCCYSSLRLSAYHHPRSIRLQYSFSVCAHATYFLRNLNGFSYLESTRLARTASGFKFLHAPRTPHDERRMMLLEWVIVNGMRLHKLLHPFSDASQLYIAIFFVSI